jgi:hypothetical protein
MGYAKRKKIYLRTHEGPNKKNDVHMKAQVKKRRRRKRKKDSHVSK